MKIGFCLPHETDAMGGDTASGADSHAIRAPGRGSRVRLGVAGRFTSATPPPGELEALGASAPPELVGRVYGAWECMVTAGALARETRRVEIGTLVVNTGYRNPALLARMADTIDELSEGRLILGLGAGDFESEHIAFGYPWERRVGRFEEALQIIRPLLRGEKVTFEGEFYTTHEAENIPKGLRAGGPPVMIGVLGSGPRMKRLVAQHADQWNCWLASGDSHARAYVEIRDAMLAGCEKHGRDPATLELNVTVRVCPPGGQPVSEDMQPLTGSACADRGAAPGVRGARGRARHGVAASEHAREPGGARRGAASASLSNPANITGNGCGARFDTRYLSSARGPTSLPRRFPDARPPWN